MSDCIWTNCCEKLENEFLENDEGKLLFNPCINCKDYKFDESVKNTYQKAKCIEEKL